MWQREGGLWFDLFRLACHGLTLAIFMGFLGAVLPLGDSLAIFRIEFTALLAIAGVVAYKLGRTLIPMMAMITVCVSVMSLVPYAGANREVDAPDLVLHQHNVMFGNPRLDELIVELDQTGADLLTLQEISETNFARIKAGLGTDYPHFKVCLYDRGGVAIMARDLGPLLDHGCVAKSRMAWMRIGTELGPITVVSIHQLWPWPKGQFWQREALADDIARLPRPVIMGGDFNNVPWSSAVRSAAGAADGRLARGLGRSFVFDTPWPLFRIDHVVAPLGAQLRAARTPGWGSDHLGLTAQIRLRPQEPGAR